jgi:tetratricopeptide (TPR) repeat protein
LLEDGAAEAQVRLEPWLERSGPQERFSTTLLPLLAWAWSNRGEVERAEALLAECLEKTREQHYNMILVDALRVRAMLVLRRGEWKEAKQALDEALSLSQAIPSPYAEAKPLHVYGQIDAATGEKEHAYATFQAGLAILHQMGERLYAGHIERALEQLS